MFTNLIDAHSHTVVSGHAYNTMCEMVAAAHKAGLKYLAITEHAPAMPGSCHAIYFSNYKAIDRTAFPIRVLLGAELNILDGNSSFDLPERIIELQDLTIASMHTPTFGADRDMGTCTRAVMNALASPYVNILGHPDDGQFPLDYETVIPEAARAGVIVELNNASFSPWSYRVNGRKNAAVFLRLCVEHRVPIIVDSDAHFYSRVGDIRYALEVLKENDFPGDLILNDKPDRFFDIINARRSIWGGEPISMTN